MNNIECTFKLAYTCNKFDKVIDINISPYDLKNCIRPIVSNRMGLNDFKIIIAGTILNEENVPLDCSIRNINILSLVGIIYNNHIAFYIKPLGNNNNNNYIIYNNIDNDYIINHNYTNYTDVINSINDSGNHDSGNHDSGDHDSGNHDSGNHDSGNHDSGNGDCPVCYTTFTSLQTVSFGCNHTFCRSCIANWFRTGVITCPLCRS